VLSAGDVVIVRADGSRRIGFGHIGRMIPVAHGLRDAGLHPLFVTRAEPGVLERLAELGFSTDQVPLDASWATDDQITAAAVLRRNARAIVTDLSHDDALADAAAYGHYLERLRRLGPLLMAFDDLGRLPGPADIVVNPNLGATEPPGAPAGTRYLLGPRYFACARRLADIGRRRVHREPATRILVSMGGGDVHGVAGKVVRALGRVPKAETLEVVVLLGLETDPVALGGVSFPGRVRLVTRVADMAEQLEWADLAVTAAGLTKYETAVTGVPSLMVAQAEHQEALGERFAREGSAWYLGPGPDVTEDAITRAMATLLSDRGRRLAMSRAGRTLVDGRGVERIVESLRVTAGAAR
jgi:spore coat polysaccharide biosynthesis predicted glycosyltransferase SpsG